MFDDLKNEINISKEKLKEQIEKIRQAMKDGRDYILEQKNEISVLKKSWNESYNAAKDLSGILDEVLKVIKNKKLKKEFEHLIDFEELE